MPMRTGLLGVCLALAAVAGSARADLVLQIDANGILTGATGVLVDGTPYDVIFEDGSCDSLFPGCNPGRFTFHSATEAIAASSALLSQVFLDTAQGDFDSKSYLTAGCGHPAGCVTLTPYAYDQVALVSIAENFLYPPSDAVHADLGANPGFDTSTDDLIVYAIWSPSAKPVPEPPVALLVGSALLVALGATRRGALHRRAPSGCTA
jgi:hypothetical protein